MKTFFSSKPAIFFMALATAAVDPAMSGAAVGAERIRVGLTTKDFGYLPLFVGIRAGYFTDEGLDVQWIQVRANVATSALIGGDLDIAASAGSAMRTAVRGAALKAIFSRIPSARSF